MAAVYLTGPGDQINTDPMLGPLQDNGGPTFTHALLPGSPAIDAGDPNFTPPPFYDQRGPGFDRVVNGRIDIGSFEVQGPTPTATPCGGAWIDRSPVPYDAGGMFATSDGRYVYTGAGGDVKDGHNELLRYDPKNNSWIQLASSPDEHALSQAVYFKGKLYNMGGFLGNLSQVSNTTRIYDIATNTWTTGKPMPARLGAPATMLWEGIIYVAGGYDGAERWTRYTPIISRAAPGARLRQCHRHCMPRASELSTASYTLPAVTPSGLSSTRCRSTTSPQTPGLSQKQTCRRV